jgi:type II restriction enzyme
MKTRNAKVQQEKTRLKTALRKAALLAPSLRMQTRALMDWMIAGIAVMPQRMLAIPSIKAFCASFSALACGGFGVGTDGVDEVVTGTSEPWSRGQTSSSSGYSFPQLGHFFIGECVAMLCCLFCYVKADLPRQPKSVNFSLRLGVSALISLNTIREDRTPNLLLMRSALATWEVRDLLLIPSFMFSESAVIKRKPLAATARRAGWVGCNLDLHRIAPEARIALVITRSSGREPAPSPSRESRESQSRLTSAATIIVPPEEVRAKYKRVKPLENISVTQRGWTLDVLNIVRRLGKPEFTNDDVYVHDRELERLHPDNRNIRPKIRQQLQILRDTGLLIHVESGRWRLP